jgi:hypothetical protein
VPGRARRLDRKYGTVQSCVPSETRYAVRLSRSDFRNGNNGFVEVPSTRMSPLSDRAAL